MSIKKTKLHNAIKSAYYMLKNWDKTKDDIVIAWRLRKFKNKHKGETCVIVGNGPSLKSDDLTKLNALKIPTFACNRIHLIFETTPWRPTYYFMSDEKLIHQYADDIQGVPAEHRFFPKQYRDIVTKGTFYNTLLFNYNQEGKFSLNAGKGVYAGCSVTTEMIQFAYFMGFFEIYLIGVDFSYAITKKLDSTTYAYQGENNYFIPGYLKPGEVADMPNVNANLLAYQAAKEAIEKQRRFIGNATRGGKLEVFQRVNLDEVLKKWERM